MSDIPFQKETSPPRILLYSQRHISPYDVWRSPHYEFEDLICKFDSVRLLAPRPSRWFSVGNKIANGVARYSPFTLHPGITTTKIENRYDMLFVLCSFPRDLLTLNLGAHWKDVCKTSVCMIDEIWIKQIPQQKCYFKLLSKFDHILLYYSQSVRAIGELTGRKTYFVPPGIDAIQFCPYPNPPMRVIDVYSIGRKSPTTHQSLLEMANKGNLFYIFDSLSGSKSHKANEHRGLLANMAKRSRFYIVNPGLIDRPDKRGNQIEIGNRYFEGAAAGCIMIGEIPRNEAFKDLFFWPDAVFDHPFDSDRIDLILDEIDQQPEREKEIRKNNIVHSLRHHDWVYRWESILNIAGLDPTPEMQKRKEQLEKLTTLVDR